MSQPTVTIAVTGSVLCGTEPMQPGSPVRLYLDSETTPGLPEYIMATTLMPVRDISVTDATVCAGVPGTEYTFKYTEADLLGVIPVLLSVHVSAIKCQSEYDLLADRVAAVFRDDIRGITGGGADKLDSIRVGAAEVGTKITFLAGGTWSYEESYVLRSGVVSSTPPIYILPANYDATYNAFYWHRITPPANLSDVYWSTAAGSFTVTPLRSTSVLHYAAGPTATFTLTLEGVEGCLGQEVEFITEGVITTMLVNTTVGGTFYGKALPTSLAAGDRLLFRCQEDLRIGVPMWIRLA